MIVFDDYHDRYENINLSRDDTGVLTMRLHTKGDKHIFSLKAHDEITDCLMHVSRDWYNKVVILTGTGEAFIKDTKAAKRFLESKRPPMWPCSPLRALAQKLRGCASARREVMASVPHCQDQYANNRVAVSHEPTRE